MTDNGDKGLFMCIKYGAQSIKHVMLMILKKATVLATIKKKRSKEYIQTHKQL